MNSNIENKKSNILYKKKGKKYVQANDPWAYDGLRDGWWLVGVNVDGCSTTIRQQVWPDRAPVEVVFRQMESKIIDIIHKASEARPRVEKLTEEQKKDWDRFIKKHGHQFSTLQYPSMHDNAVAVVNAMREVIHGR